MSYPWKHADEDLHIQVDSESSEDSTDNPFEATKFRTAIGDSEFSTINDGSSWQSEIDEALETDDGMRGK